ncbi:hypothetical protein DdX_11258 [Ditylenchus destructor]|uniref:Uncharacterized protein n=1 Tax=Ditylenchus destructor TaxID=166010 RepID=A0AAD4MZM9_9BILA|nr:hypothetical protein DdX_11258 [Ditylenchus destructor]
MTHLSFNAVVAERTCPAPPLAQNPGSSQNSGFHNLAIQNPGLPENPGIPNPGTQQNSLPKASSFKIIPAHDPGEEVSLGQGEDNRGAKWIEHGTA